MRCITLIEKNNNVRGGKTDVKSLSGSNKLNSITFTLQCYFETSNLLLSFYLLKFAVFSVSLMTKAINSFTSAKGKINTNKKNIIFCRSVDTMTC